MPKHRLVEELHLDKKTVLRAIHFLGEKCRTYHQELLNMGFLATDKIQFDEVEGYIHSKIYPVSIGSAELFWVMKNPPIKPW